MEKEPPSAGEIERRARVLAGEMLAGEAEMAKEPEAETAQPALFDHSKRPDERER